MMENLMVNYWREIPDEVMFHYIFPFLEINDLLRLRRVSKVIKPKVEEYLRLHGTSKDYLRIDNRHRDGIKLSELLDLDFVVPFTKFRINMSGEMEEELREFGRRYRKKITHLRLESLEIPIISGRVSRFFESLGKLEHLEIFNLSEQGVRFSLRQNDMVKKQSIKKEDLAKPIPGTFKRLKTLIIHTYNCVSSVESTGLVWKFVEECSNQLEFLGDPRLCSRYIDLEDLPGGPFGWFLRLLENSALSNLKFFDLSSAYRHGHVSKVDTPAVQDFYELVTVCSKYNVKLLDVNARLIEGMMALETRDKEDHGKKISNVVGSLRYLHKSSFLLELPHLEKVSLGCSGGTRYNVSMPLEFQRKNWPNLKELEFKVDSEYLWDPDRYVEQRVKTKEVLKFLFVGIQREKMEKLTMSFQPLQGNVPSPRIINICESCPNLKELTLIGWSGSIMEISNLWGNLPLLEKAKFVKGQIGDTSFMGEDKQNPAIKKAKRLRSLHIEKMDAMSRVTDVLFVWVLRHMPLKELRLQSSGIISKVTKGGVTSLLNGVFSKTVEKLELNIKLEDADPADLRQLEQKFRSSKML